MNKRSAVGSNLSVLRKLMVSYEEVSALKPVILFGSLLGIVRDGDLISWNNDIELGIHKDLWDEKKLSSLIDKLRTDGFVVNYYKIIKAVSIRTPNRDGEVHLNYFANANGLSARPLEPSSPLHANLVSYCLYAISICLSGDLDLRSSSILKKFFYRLNLILPNAFRYRLSLIAMHSALFFTKRRGIYLFPFTLTKPEEFDFHEFRVYLPQNARSVVAAIYGKDWQVPKVGWSFYDQKNSEETEVRLLPKKWAYDLEN